MVMVETYDKKAFYRTIWALATPIVLQNMITIGVNMMDTFMLGSYGEIQLSGSSLAIEFVNIFHILCMGMGSGAAVLTAQRWGSGDIAGLKKVVTIMLRCCIAIASFFTLASLAWPNELMRIFTSDPAIVEKGAIYYRIHSPAFLFMGLSLTLTMVMRSIRLVKIPLIGSIVTFFVNIFFNWVFIYGKLGAPEMQIGGAALGTVIARVVEAALIGGYFLLVDRRVGYRIRDLFRSCKDEISNYVRFSMPVLVSDLLLALGNSAVAIVMGHMGAAFVAANAIISQIVRLSTVFNQGISNASGTMTGNTLGEGKMQTAYRQGVSFLRISVAVGLLAALLILVISPLIVGAYNLAEETRHIAMQLMHAVSIMVVFQAVQSVLTKGVLRGGGDTRFLMVADVAFLWLASVPLGYLAAYVFNLPAFWVYLALKIDWAIKAIWCTFRLKGEKWMRIV